MANGCNNNLRNELEDIFKNLEAQSFDISHRMVILMEMLARKFGPSKEFGSFNFDNGSNEKFEDKEELEKRPKKGESSFESHLPNLYSNWKQKRKSNPIKVSSML